MQWVQLNSARAGYSQSAGGAQAKPAELSLQGSEWPFRGWRRAFPGWLRAPALLLNFQEPLHGWNLEWVAHADIFPPPPLFPDRRVSFMISPPFRNCNYCKKSTLNVTETEC